MSETQKDVIYVDVEDDITTIISKVKASNHKVIAVVPPKRIGVLQSAVNLRLLSRAAKQDEKHLVLVTSNSALLALAGAASLPVAKNLQTKPELAEVPNIEPEDTEEDVIDGADLPVGGHAKQATNEDDSTDEDSDTSAAITAGLAAAAANGESIASAQSATKGRTPKSAVRVPDFHIFRKKLFLGITGAVLLVGFLVWALIFAPRATIVIAAKTTSASVNTPVMVVSSAPTDLTKSTIAASVQQQQTPKTIEFSPTGQKDVGTKATGTIKLVAQSLTGVSMAAGTPLQSTSGLTYITDSAVVVPASSFGPGCFPTACPGKATVTVTAAENGSKYNAATGVVNGTPTTVTGSFASPTSGGLSKMVTVVTKEDVDKIKESLNTQNIDAVKSELKAKFGDGSVPIDQSFVVEYTDVTTTPAVDAEVTSEKATLTAKLTYKMYGVTKQELASFIEAYVKKDTNGLKNQRIYEDGTKNAVFQEVTKVENGAKATLVATAQVGPKINDDEVRQQVKGKRFGEVQQSLQAIQGVDSVDINFFPFWVSTVPSDDSKISIEFKLNGNS